MALMAALLVALFAEHRRAERAKVESETLKQQLAASEATRLRLAGEKGLEMKRSASLEIKLRSVRPDWVPKYIMPAATITSDQDQSPQP
jgi:hypothetical protein